MSESAQPVEDQPAQGASRRDETAPRVTVDRVSVQLGDVEALAGVSTEVGEGCLMGLIGPNGAGKTTLLRTITNAVRPDAGAVYIDDVDVADLSSQAVSRKVAVVPQDTALGFDFDVRDIVAMGRTPYIGRFGANQPADTDAVEQAMAQTAVLQFASRSISEVSGGERQRVLLARAIAQETPVLLLDEPTASLDIKHQVQTLELVRELVEQGKTVIAAIHDLNLAARYCDELLLLADGEVMARGTPETVLTAQNVKAAFGTPSIVGPHAITGSVHVTPFPDRQRNANGHVHVFTSDGDGSAVLSRIRAEGYAVSAGPLLPGDATAVTADQLGVETITVDPLAPIDENAKDRIEAAVETADATILVDIDLRPGMLDALPTASTANRLILLEDRPLAERNQAGDVGERLYNELRQGGRSMSREAFLSDIQGALAGEVRSDQEKG